MYAAFRKLQLCEKGKGGMDPDRPHFQLKNVFSVCVLQIHIEYFHVRALTKLQRISYNPLDTNTIRFSFPFAPYADIIRFRAYKLQKAVKINLFCCEI